MSSNLPGDNHPLNSPSKSSLRRRSGGAGADKNSSPGPTTHFAAETTQHHFLPHSPPNQNVEYVDEDEEDAGEENYSGEASYQTALQPPVPFEPFFTLIEDTITQEHYHPVVHYIFADDEADIITEAACRSLAQGDSSLREAQSEDHGRNSDLPLAQPNVKEHYIILDIEPATTSRCGFQQQLDRLPSPHLGSAETTQAQPKAQPFTVTSAQSLSSEWQVFRTNIIDAPTMNPEPHADEQHLMLRIEGRGPSPDRPLQRRDGEDIEDLIERYQARLTELRHLLANIEAPEDTLVGPANVEGDMLGGLGFRSTGFGNAILDEQD